MEGWQWYGNNRVELLRKSNNEVLMSQSAPDSDGWSSYEWDVSSYIGVEVYIKVYDEAADTGYSWVAVDGFSGGTGVVPVKLKSGVYLRGGYDNSWAHPPTGDRSSTVISGGEGIRCMTGKNLSSLTTIENFTISNGRVPGDYGGGLYLTNSSLTIKNCAITSNYADSGGNGMYISGGYPTIVDSDISNNQPYSYYGGYGGGIYNSGGSLEVKNCTFSNNYCWPGYGGGLYSSGGSSTIEGCTFSSWNTAYVGGGIYNNSGSLTIKNSVISNNDAQEEGGGLYVNSGSVTIESCAFTSNRGDEYGGGGICGSPITIKNSTIEGNSGGYYGGGEGGGLYLWGPVTIKGCKIAGNSCNGDYYGEGGGLYISGSPTTMENCAVTGNTANGNYEGGQGGGLYIGGSTTIRNCTITGNIVSDGYEGGGRGGGIYGSPTIKNSIVYGNSASTDPNISGSPTVTYSDIGGGWSGTGNISSEPFFFNPPSNVHLFNSSPCVDKGDNTALYYGLDYTNHYGTNPDGVHGDSVVVDMGYHYSGYTLTAVTDTTPPVVTIESPVSGATVETGTVCNISWKASDTGGLLANSVSIYYSINNGATYTLIISGTGETSSGNYAWTVPDVRTNEAKIKVRAVDTSYNIGTKETGSLNINGIPRTPTGLVTTNIAGTTAHSTWEAKLFATS